MNWIKSRTLWTLVFMFSFNGWNAISASVDPTVTLLINAAFTALAGHFRINARVNADQ